MGLKPPHRFPAYTPGVVRPEEGMTDKEGMDKTARALRIYEYVDADGVVFWSFAYLPGGHVRRLNLSDNRGIHYRTFISDVQTAAFQKDLLDEEDGG